MELRIITPTSTTIHSISWIEIGSTRGSFVVQEGHAPMILVLQPTQKIVFLLDNGKTESVPVHLGLAHIERTMVTVVMNSAV